jgi:sigma-B regulation protein RsbU (phosphoserine phosphatase)
LRNEQRAEILRNCSFLRGAEDSVLEALAAVTSLCQVAAGETVMTKGDEGSTMYFMASGTVRVHDGDAVLAHLGTGEVFGEMAVLDADARSATVTAESPAVLLGLQRDDLWRVVATRPASLRAIIAAVLQRERSMVRDVTSRTLQVHAFEKEMEIGRRIQADFLPEHVPQVAGWEIAAQFEAARVVAGDFYDVFELKPARHLAIVIGDVCDKGVGAALFMTLFRSLIRATSLSGFLHREAGPGKVVATGGDATGANATGANATEADAANGDVNAQVRNVLLDSVATTNRYIATTHSRSSMFASVFFGVLDPLSGDLLYVNGGHESPMIFGAGGRHEVLEVTGGVLGLFPFARFGVAATQLQPGDLLFSYTDGVNEAKNETGEQFTEQRIRDAAAAGWTDAAGFTQQVLQRIREFRGSAAQSDDITMLAVRRIFN